MVFNKIFGGHRPKGGSHAYRITKFLDQGTFHKEFQCSNYSTSEKAYVKAFHYKGYGSLELLMYQELRKLDPDKNNLVRVIDLFWCEKHHVCLALELLDRSIYDYVLNVRPLRLPEIQVITQQLLVALNALKSRGIVHTNINPRSIMLVNNRRKPCKIKLTEFGLAQPLWSLQMNRGKKLQEVFYRAPEVMLGLKLTEAIDMWSVGCVLAFMYVGKSIFTECEYNNIKLTLKNLGQPADQLLGSGLFTKHFFTKEENIPTSSWRLNTHSEYTHAVGVNRHKCCPFFSCESEDCPDLNKVFQCDETQAFLRLVQNMLNVDPAKRINPTGALESHFVNMRNLSRNTVPKKQVLPLNFMRMISQVEEWSCISKSTTDVFNEADIHNVGTDDQENKQPPEKSAAAGANEKPPNSAITVAHKSHPGANEGTTGCVEVKTRKKYLKRIHKSFKGHKKNDKPPGKTGSGDSVAVETDEKTSNKKNSASPSSVFHNSDTSPDEGPSTEVTPKKTFVKRIRKFFSRVFKSASG